VPEPTRFDVGSGCFQPHNCSVIETRIKVGIAEDHGLFREMLAECQGAAPDIDVCAVAASVKDARVKFNVANVDVALLDVFLPDGNGIGLGVSLQRNNPGMSVVILSNGNHGDWLLEDKDPIRRHWSYLSKHSVTSITVLQDVIRSAARGEGIRDPGFFSGWQTEENPVGVKLTKRQLEILRLLAAGYSNREIGNQLDIGESSVINHLSSIYALLQIGEDKNPRVIAALNYLSVYRDIEG
jgi:DNA-binding NarL/FixJ family response regulator